ncbi:MAG: hypothetical protein AB1705_24365 [Verrucomicrobiota bacterium]
MPQRILEIARDEIVLGWLPEEDVREMLAAGFLKPTDTFHTGDAPDRRPLSALDESAPSEGSTQWLRKAGVTALAVGTTLAGKALEAGEGIKSLVTGTKATLDAASRKVLEDALPAIRQRVAAQLELPAIQKARAKLRDEEFMQKVFGAVYDCLPKPVTRFVNETQFIQFCQQHRRELLGDAAPPANPPASAPTGEPGGI